MKTTAQPDADALAEAFARGGSFGRELDLDAWFQRLRRATTAPTDSAGLGRLGDYELLGVAGRGGQGIVYKARQPRTGRSVALKRLAAGAFSTPEMRARFEREIEVAAALNHPHVVTVFGTEQFDDQIVLAMQWVDGMPFDDWAVGARAAGATGPPSGGRTVREILEAFVRVCDAVHYAHQRGVIHRDLKSSNILVDVAGCPHVLDFGLAKVQAPGRDHSSLTCTGGLLGTPAFAPPEVARGEHRAVDVRSDVYSLGVVLYAALTGRLPHPPAEDLGRLLHDIQHQEPPLLSSLNPRLDRELDAIIWRSIAKEQSQRYESVGALGADVRRYLAGEAVLAHPPTRAYHIRKFLRRHRLAVSAAGMFLGLLLAATTISTVLYLRAEEQRQRAAAALERQKVLSDAQEVQWERAQISHEFLRELFESAGDATPGKAALTVREFLDRAGEKLERETGQKDPAAEAALRMIVANAYRKLELPDRAEPHYVNALSLRRRVFGEDDLLVAEAMDALGRLYRVQGRLTEAEPLIEGAFALRHKLLDPNDGYLALAANTLGLLKLSLGKYDEAALAFRDAIKRYAAISPEDESIPVNMMNLAKVYIARGETAEAESTLRDALEFAIRIHGEINEDVAKGKAGLGRLLGEAGDRSGEAERLLREAADTFEKLYGREHARTRAALDDLAKLLLAQGRPAEADALSRGE